MSPPPIRLHIKYILLSTNTLSGCILSLVTFCVDVGHNYGCVATCAVTNYVHMKFCVIFTHYELWWYGIESGAFDGFVGSTGSSSSWTVLCCILCCFLWQWTHCGLDAGWGERFYFVLKLWDNSSLWGGMCKEIKFMSILWFLLFRSFLLLFCSQWFCYCSLYLWCDTVICDNEQAYDTQCLSQGHVLFLSRPVLFPVCF